MLQTAGIVSIGILALYWIVFVMVIGLDIGFELGWERLIDKMFAFSMLMAAFLVLVFIVIAAIEFNSQI